ncbi:MAG: hypothetical protein QOF51_862, partial [Chloroflexota bacterium]|nr:hypothetical protein [Chloroflexota bacterium]
MSIEPTPVVDVAGLDSAELRPEPVPSPAPLLLRPLASLPGFGAMRFREYRLLWGAQIGNAMGINMDIVARGWLM